MLDMPVRNGAAVPYWKRLENDDEPRLMPRDLATVASLALEEYDKASNPIWRTALGNLAAAADHVRRLREGQEDGSY